MSSGCRSGGARVWRTGSWRCPRPWPWRPVARRARAAPALRRPARAAGDGRWRALQGRPRLLQDRTARRPTARSTGRAFTVGLDYATKGTGAVNGRTIEVTEADDAGDPAKAVRPRRPTASAQGNTIIAGSTSSGVALQVAPLAKDNKVLFISGPAATDAVTGANKYTFRSGRQTYQDVATAGIDARRPHGQEGHRASRRTAPSARPTSPPSRRSSAPRARPSTLGRGAGRRDRLHPVRHAGQGPLPRTCSSSPGPAPTPPRCGRRSPSRASSTTTKVVTGLDIKPTHALFGEVGDKIDVPLALLRRCRRQRRLPGPRQPASRHRVAGRSTCSPTTVSSRRRWSSRR